MPNRIRLIITVFLIFIFFCSVNSLFAQTQAFVELRLKAFNGHIPTQILLSEAYRMGTNGAVVNNDSANFFARIAAEAGNPDGAYLYGIALVRGLGCKPDVKAGALWLEKAARVNNVLAVHALIDIYSTQTTSFDQVQFPTDFKKAFQYALQSAKLRHWEGPIYMGNAYHSGLGVKRNDTLAVAWMDTAATVYKRPDAQITLGNWFFKAETVFGLDMNRAEKYYLMAVNNSLSNLDQNTEAEIGAHFAVQWRPMIANLHYLLMFPEPELSLQLRVRP